MQKSKIVVMALVAIMISSIGVAYGQEQQDPEIAFSEFQLVIFGIGALAGLVTAYNGYASKKRKEGKSFVFDPRAFLDRIFIATLASIPLAIAESANIVKLDLFGAWIIFAAALGTTQLIMEVRARNKTPKLD